MKFPCKGSSGLLLLKPIQEIYSGQRKIWLVTQNKGREQTAVNDLKEEGLLVSSLCRH